MNNKSFSVAIIGVGGLGSPALISLINAWPLFKNDLVSEAGSFNDIRLSIFIFDSDQIELSNLNRQILFNHSDIGRIKSTTAMSRIEERLLSKLPDDITIIAEPVSISRSNMKKYLLHTDLVFDCTDSVTLKFDLNDFCVLNGIPFVYAGVQGRKGLVLGVIKGGACIRCVFGNFTETEQIELGGACREGGIIGSSAGLTAMYQVGEGLEILKNKLIEQNSTSSIISIRNGIYNRLPVSRSRECLLGCNYSNVKVLDLTSIKCPETYLYAKVALEDLENEEKLEIKFGSSEDLINISHSLTQDGRKIHLKTSHTEWKQYRLIVEK
ncbi:MAG TPA: ThiF family adenylyltransferase [Oligoflexia bacterium]|nr:ThiF family adenylyltransferase [Oligoflexia bacterium]HMP47925.1 ThiF family adenylyltransferase [Oligoflexia bacterium]